MTATVRDNPDRNRYEVLVDDAVAGYAEYERSEGVLELTHTVVRDEHEGEGLGSRLARTALDAARDQGLAVIPTCEYVRAWIGKHPDYVDLVPEDRRADFGL